MNKTRIKRSLPIIIGAIVAILLATTAAAAIRTSEDQRRALQRQEQTIKQEQLEKHKLHETLKDAKKQIEIKQQEIQQRDQTIQEKDQQLQAKAEAKRVAALAAAQAAEAARNYPPAASSVSWAPSAGSGSCEAEIAKYDWPQGTARAVMIAESGGDPGIVNDNPDTKDYSVGCFQVNLYGENAKYRPSEAALKIAATNVAWAYNNWKANGNSFWGQWGVCGGKAAC